MKLASLFDGSGGFPLAGMLVGIEPVWASEIEPFPIRVTTKRFPNMKHYGDVSKIDGAKVEPVDIITFGSPCQDLSIAGKRAGLEDGLRSNLFYQAVRIIKEMRKETNGKYPRYAVWENVPGAYSSNNGDDFRSVLETLARVNDGTVSIPKSVWGGKDLSWEMVFPSAGEHLMRNTGEFPKEENESFLSQILMDGVPKKYYLSQKACRGILRRASERGKDLPMVLKAALENQANA